MPGRARDDRARVRLEGRARILVDDRPDVGREQRRIADRKRVHDAREQLQHARRDVLLHEEHAQRRAALAGGVEGGRHGVVDDLLRQRGAVHEHRVLAAGLRDQRPAAARRCAASERLMSRAVSVEPVKATPAMRGSPVSVGPIFEPRPGTKCSTSPGNAACVQQAHHLGGDERRLLRRLRDHGIAGGERGRHLAGEDREREIPGADAGEDAAAAQAPGGWIRRSGPAAASACRSPPRARAA